MSDSNCPFCGAAARAGSCPCGARAIDGTVGSGVWVDEVSAAFDISASPVIFDLADPKAAWLADFHIELKAGAGGRSWLKRSLPWEKAETTSGEEELAALAAQAERLYEKLFDSRHARADFREAKEAFETAAELARRLGKRAEATRLTARLKHLEETWRRQLGG